MKNILRNQLNKTIIISRVSGYACPRCKYETWATRNSSVKDGYCYACAYTGEPLKIIEKDTT